MVQKDVRKESWRSKQNSQGLRPHRKGKQVCIFNSKERSLTENKNCNTV